MKFLFKWWKHFESEHREQESEILREEISYLQPACKRHDLSCSHNNGDLFMCEDLTHYFHVWNSRYLVLGQKFTWYCIGGYNKSKLFHSGLIGFTKSLAKEVALRNVRVNMVAPGFIETDMTSNLRKQNSGIEALIPLRRYGTVHEVAETVCFLAETPYITGQVRSPLKLIYCCTLRELAFQDSGKKHCML